MTEQNNDKQMKKTESESEGTAERGSSHRQDRRYGGKRKGGRNQGRGRSHRHGDRRRSGPHRRPRTEEMDPKVAQLIKDAEETLKNSHQPVQLDDLTPFERKQVHQHFERKNTDFQTKTYRRNGDYSLWIFPVANLKKFAEDKAQEALDTGNDVALPPMSNYERFIVHSILKENESIETSSVGEDDDRHIEIRPKRFGRRLKRIVKKIKLF